MKLLAHKCFAFSLITQLILCWLYGKRFRCYRGTISDSSAKVLTGIGAGVLGIFYKFKEDGLRWVGNSFHSP